VSSQMQLAPVVNAVTVNAPLERAFEVFTGDVGSWWPLDRYAVAVDDENDQVTAVDSIIEPRAGGRWYEVRSDSSEADWGEVLVFEAPHRLVATWHPGRSADQATEIEVRFTPEGDATRVELTHRGWERLGDRAADARQGYEGGWAGVLANYAEIAGS
jgi:uncharacterized protein YndB with AHSA1/START domain